MKGILRVRKLLLVCLFIVEVYMGSWKASERHTGRVKSTSSMPFYS